MVCCSSGTASWSGLGGACSGHTRATAGRWWWRGRQGAARPCCWRRPGMRQGKRGSGGRERAKPVLPAAARDGGGEAGFRVLRARGAEREREFAFGVVRQLVEPVVAGASQQERAWLLDGPPRGGGRPRGLP